MDQGTTNVISRLRYAYQARYGKPCQKSDETIASEWMACKQQLHISYLTDYAEQALLAVLHRD